MAYTLEVWASSPARNGGAPEACKVLVMLDEEPTEKQVSKAEGDVTAVWRRWFVIGHPERAEEWPATTGHKVTE